MYRVVSAYPLFTIYTYMYIIYMLSVGDSIALDVATVHHDNQFLRYNISLLGYGFYGDCLLDSEQNRWMGPRRYTWAGKCAFTMA